MTEAIDAEQLQRELETFTGRNQTYYTFPIETGFVFTEGVRHLAWRAQARWLIADIVFAQDQSARVQRTAFQVWKLEVHLAGSGILRCEDGNGRQVYFRRYISTDFPLPEVTLFLTGGVIYLPSEH